VKCEEVVPLPSELLALAIHHEVFREGDDLRRAISLSPPRSTPPSNCRPRPAWYPPRGPRRAHIATVGVDVCRPIPTSASPPGSWQSTHRRPRSWPQTLRDPSPTTGARPDLTLVRDVGVLVRPGVERPNTATTGTSSPSKV
jgi:hypothetical protein